MIEKIKMLMISVTGSFLLMTGIMPAGAAALNCNAPANSTESQQCGACAAAGVPADECGQAPKKSTDTLNRTIANIINLLSVVAGIIAVIMLIFGGYRYITGGGNDQAIASAKRTLIYALIGLVIVALSQLIVRFVLGEVTTNK